MSFLKGILDGARATVRREWDAALREAAEEVTRSRETARLAEQPGAPAEPPKDLGALRADPASKTNAEIEDLREAATKLFAELDFYKRRSEAYFGLIEKIEAQREEWKLLYRRDSSGHQHAQATLQECIVQLRQQVIGALRAVNELRKEKGLAEVNLASFAVNAPPVGIAEETKARNEADLRNAPVQIDAQKELKAIEMSIIPPAGITVEPSGAT